jgi:hypothetical protein
MRGRIQPSKIALKMFIPRVRLAEPAPAGADRIRYPNA